MENEQPPKQKLAEIIKRLEGNGHKVTNMAEKVKSIGFVGGIGEHQKRNHTSLEQETKPGNARNTEGEGKETRDVQGCCPLRRSSSLRFLSV